MKKIIAAVLCLIMLLSLCACTSGNSSEKLRTKTKFTPTWVKRDGIMYYYEMDEKKTPEIHKAIDLYNEHEYEAAIAQFTLALGKGEFDPIVFHKLGYMYEEGLGVEQNVEFGHALYEEGAKYDQPSCIFNLGIYYYDHSDSEKALEYFERVAELDVPFRYVGLGIVYGRTHGYMEPDKEKSDEYLKKAYESKDPETVYDVGHFYLFSDDPEEASKGMDIIEEAAELGYAKAYEMLGTAYENGIGVEKDGEKAYENYLKAAQTSRFDDYYDRVGYCYENGIGVEVDYEKAVECYEKAAKAKSGMGWYDLGRMYENGWGVEKNIGESINCFNMAVKYKYDCIPATGKLESALRGLQ